MHAVRVVAGRRIKAESQDGLMLLAVVPVAEVDAAGTGVGAHGDLQ